MSVNSSSSSSFSFWSHCAEQRTGLHLSSSYVVIRNLLLLPLSTLVLHLGLQRWRLQRSFVTAGHSDVFTYNMATIELIFAVGGVAYCCRIFIGPLEVTAVGLYFSAIVFPGQMCFHSLTCVERYLAVVHPITSLGLKQSGGVMIRNISTVCAWLLCFLWSGVTCFLDFPTALFFSSLIFSVIVVSFCSLRVLCVLIRPGPGEVGGDRGRVDQSKERAFHTITAITGVLWLWFAGTIVCLALDTSSLLSEEEGCLLLISANWFSLPSSLVLPLLFLHRAGKLPCCR